MTHIKFLSITLKSFFKISLHFRMAETLLKIFFVHGKLHVTNHIVHSYSSSNKVKKILSIYFYRLSGTFFNYDLSITFLLSKPNIQYLKRRIFFREKNFFPSLVFFISIVYFAYCKSFVSFG